MSTEDVTSSPPDFTPPVIFEMSLRSSVWTLRRSGKVVMRSRVEHRVEHKMSDLAKREAAWGGHVTVTRKLKPDGSTFEFTWEPERARENLEALQASIDRLLEIAREEREKKRIEREGGGQ